VFTGASTTINFPYYALPATNTVQAFTASGIVTSTGASVTATPAITFIYPVQISAGASTVSIPSGTTMTTPSNSDFTAIIATTSVITANLPSNSGVAGAMQYGFTSTTIVLSQPITITIPVSSSYDGQTLAVYNSEDGGVSWTQFTTCTVAGSACSFTTSNLSSFAVVVPLTPITPSNPSGPVVDVASGGGFYFPSAVATSTAIVSAPTSSLSTTGMTVAQMENLLASLQAELQALEAKSGSQASAVFTRDLVAGMTGNDVKQLQLFLIQADVGSAAQKLKANGVTHYFGSLTKAALIELQKHADIIPAVGYFGPITRKYVNSFFP
jgi:hypothetical protein